MFLDIETLDHQRRITVLIGISSGQIEVPVAGRAGPAARTGGNQVDLEAQAFECLFGVFIKALPAGPVGIGQQADGVVPWIDAGFFDGSLDGKSAVWGE